MRVLADLSTTVCRACGGVAARPGKFGVCGDCLTSHSATLFERHFGPLTETTIQSWLAAKLLADLARYKAGRTVHRCEALSEYRSDISQCAQVAQTMRDGRHVCTSHSKKAGVEYVSDPILPSYHRFGLLIRDLARVDSLFAETIRMALAA